MADLFSGEPMTDVSPISVQSMKPLVAFNPTSLVTCIPPLPRFLLLYGSLRDGSHSRCLTELAAECLRKLGSDVFIYDPHGLPMPGSGDSDHPKVVELRALVDWADGHVWCSPEWHGTITGVFKNQVDWFPYEREAQAAAPCRTLAVMQVSGGMQSFNAVNSLRLLGRWMHLWAVPNQLSLGLVAREFDERGQFISEAPRDRLKRLMSDLHRFTLLMRGQSMMAAHDAPENNLQVAAI